MTMALIGSTLGKFVRGASGAVANIAMDKIKAEIIAERDAKLEAMRNQAYERENAARLEADQRAKDFSAQQQITQNEFTEKRDQAARAHDKEMAQIQSKTSGLPSQVLTHDYLVNSAKSKDPLISAAAKHALGIGDAVGISEKLVQGYVKMLHENQIEKGISEGSEKYRSLQGLREDVVNMLVPQETKSGEPKEDTFIFEHPKYGKIMESDISEIMRKNNKTRDEVIKKLMESLPPNMAFGQVQR
jgi:hypothetical protein